MPQPDFRKLLRSLSTKSYEKLPLRKHMATLASRQEGEKGRLSSPQELGAGNEPHREVKPR